MTNPIQLLEDRLKEINAIDCQDKSFIDYKNQYVATLSFLRVHGFGLGKKSSLNELEKAYVMLSKKRTKTLSDMFNVSERVISQQKKKFKKTLEII